MRPKTYAIILAGVLCLPAIGGKVHAEWLWTPESGKWISERNINKKSAMLLYEKGQELEKAGEITKAVRSYRQLIKQYPASSVAPNAQYWIGYLLEEQGKYFQAFQEYQKLIENYPSYKKFNEILERQYQIGNLYLSGEKRRVFGVAMLPAVDKAIEIFQTIVRTAPYSSVAPRAQFNVGEAYRKIKRYGDAIPEYQKVIDNYPQSDLRAEARYQIGRSSYERSLGGAYDQSGTDAALASMERFVEKHKDSKRIRDVRRRMDDLVERKASKDMGIAEFYEQSGQFESAIIYYQSVINEYPDTRVSKLASRKLDALAQRPVEPVEKANGWKIGWPFGRKADGQIEQISEGPVATIDVSVADSARVEVIGPEQTLQPEEPAKPRKNLLAKLWPFGKKKEEVVVWEGAGDPPVAEEAMPAETLQMPVEVPEKKGKPFWAFWVKEEEMPRLGQLREEVSTPAVVAKDMVLPDSAPMDPSMRPPIVVPEKEPFSKAAPFQVPQKPKDEMRQVRSFAMEEEGPVFRLLFETTGDVEFRTFHLKGPSRLLLSFPNGVTSKLQEKITVDKEGVRGIRQHFRSEEAQADRGRPLNAIVVDLERAKDVKVYNDLDTLVVEMQKG